MGMEGGGRFERMPDISRSQKRRGEIFPGGKPEAARGEVEPGFWLEQYATPEWLESMKSTPYGENRTRESLLLEKLTGVLVESGPGMDSARKKQLREFVNAFRITAFPNMKPDEQELIVTISNNHPGGWDSEKIKVDEVRDDIQLTWQRFGFKVPDVQPDEIGIEFSRFYGQNVLEVGGSNTADAREKSEIPSETVSAVQVVLTREGEDGTEVFLGHRIAGGFLNQWSFPGGRMDEGEDYHQVGRRELREETGVDVPVGSLDFLRDTQSSTVRVKGGKMVQYDYQMRVFAVDAQDLSPHNASPDEHSEMGWMGVSEALEMHERAVAAERETGVSRPPDKIPGALAPRTFETIKFLAQNVKPKN